MSVLVSIVIDIVESVRPSVCVILWYNYNKLGPRLLIRLHPKTLIVFGNIKMLHKFEGYSAHYDSFLQGFNFIVTVLFKFKFLKNGAF